MLTVCTTSKPKLHPVTAWPKRNLKLHPITVLLHFPNLLAGGPCCCHMRWREGWARSVSGAAEVGGETLRGGGVAVCTMQWMLLQYWGSVIISEQIQYPQSSALSEAQINIPHSALRPPLPISAPNKERIFHTQRTRHEIYHLLQRIERNCFPRICLSPFK